MVTPQKAHDLLVIENPAPTVPVRRPSASGFLATASIETIRLGPARPRAKSRGPLVAFAVFVLVLLIGVLVTVNSPTEPDVVDTVQPPPTSPPEPSTPTTLSELARRAEDLASAYSSGDFESVKALLAPGTSYGWTRASDFAMGPVLWSEEEFEARYEIGVALNTTITVTDCEDLDENRVSCAILRVDDLVRARALEPVPDVRWRLTFDNSMITEWTHQTPDISAYFRDAREPFHQWLKETHPEMEHPATDLRGQPWRADTDFADIAGDLIVEYAASLGVDLGG